MNNSSLVSSAEASYAANARLYWIYAGQGMFLIITNVLIFGTITFHEPLRQRKEYIVIAGLAFVDFGQGFGFFTAGLIRNLYIMEGTAGKLVSRIDCLLKPWNITFMWSSPLSYIFLLPISVDRFIAIKFPIAYYKFTIRYAIYLVGGTYLFMLVNLLIGIIFTLPYSYPEVGQVCFTESAFVTWYYRYYTWLALACDFLSIVLYAVVICLSFNMITNDDDSRISAHQRRAMKKQRKVTRTLGLFSLFTLLFNCLPLMGKLLLQPYFGGVLNLYIPYTSVINNLSPISNFFAFTLRHRDLRIGMKHFLRCKRLTEAALHAASIQRVTIQTISNA